MSKQPDIAGFYSLIQSSQEPEPQKTQEERISIMFFAPFAVLAILGAVQIGEWAAQGFDWIMGLL